MKILKERQLKSQLRKVFNAVGIYKEYQSYQDKKKIYPKIHSARELDNGNKIEFVFTLLNGMDPKEVKKKEYAFYQVFGSTLEIETDNIKKYTLTVYKKDIESRILWSYKKVKDLLKDYEVPVVAGVNKNNQYVTFDLIENPHLLISGTTGSGKSTQLRSVLMTLIAAMPPEKLELYLADLKMAEFQFFRYVKHVKNLCLTREETKAMLIKIMVELEKRQALIVEEGVTHVKDLEKKRVPYIIVAIDEFASLKDDDAMEIILELGNRGRALGIYLILSILRPDAKTVDSRIKGNLNATMGFKAKNAINANVIGTPGAENLKGKGRFLLDSLTVDGMPELQGIFLSEKRLKKLLEPYKVSKEEWNVDQQPEEIDDEENDNNEPFNGALGDVE
ncbi:S-DNA-T family DNA segregation ATPase FtsK/SpoIIIE [Evansella vedderi]|uniref:S-DNA-T family DNA segregation ATPase FtsK/SpoIIIE n=1 Tax=Evansella vedderi TaxID=38282 RepID=A0ABU0A359_9BACI|nr:FtsK/SpoIIIE domain-containing protein [Evansella vedderi]MDQ0257923.1 S-DNA-T family DNA segregation ATPase FtsK/SpoIIIE [Evansella vedderi]